MRFRLPRRLTAATASASLSDKGPLTPCSISSGVWQAERVAQQPVALSKVGCADTADLGRPMRLDFALEIAAVLHDAGQDQRPASSTGHTDGVRSTLVGMNAAEEQ